MLEVVDLLLDQVRVKDSKKPEKNTKQLLAEHLSNLGRTEYSAGYESLSDEIQGEADKLAAENVEKTNRFCGWRSRASD